MKAAWVDRWSSGKRVALVGDYRWIEVGEATIRVRVCGPEGASIVVAADAPNVIEHYDGWAERVREAFPDRQIVIFEFPGFGFSTASGRYDFGLTAMARVTREVLRQTCSGPSVLAFPCAGGYVAIEVARRWPELVERLHLAQTPAPKAMKRWLKRVDRWHLLQTPYVGQMIMKLGRGRIAREWYRAALPKGAAIGAYAETASDVLKRGGSFSLASFIQAFADLESHSFGQVAAPTTVLWGELDRTHRGTEANSLQAVMAGAEIIPVACGHFPDLEATDTWIQALTAHPFAATR